MPHWTMQTPTWEVLVYFVQCTFWVVALIALMEFTGACGEVRKLREEFARVRTVLERLPHVRRAAMQDNAKATPAGQAVPRAVPAFVLRPSFAQRRAQWEAAHNKKAQMAASISEQIRKAKEGTLT